MLRWNRINTLKQVIPSNPGIYKFYDKNRDLLYVGHAKNLRHRVQSYREDHDFHTHPTKAPLRPRIAYYVYQVMPLQKARIVEKEIKRKAPYNKL